ncbi:GNAT family N-acetyltransferase [Paenibacillus sp. R14(2021)]|uniref:GNAT family N-acetyltransferase n=1 Tax=Paenibacillus sp. R14(2021) TaxID=2859228 RepID=UPI001C614C55|nr:GNAT family protein [Paenibacillus sp. R14(2021)]
MANFPTLETERLVLRQLRGEDAEDLFHYFAMDEVTRYYDVDSFTEQKQAEELINNWQQRFDRSLGYRWGITHKTEDRVIGTCGFHNWTKEHMKSEIGYELSPSVWNRGIMTEVLKAVIQFGFEELRLNRIEACIDPANSRSRKLLLRSGFLEEGLLREYFFEKNQFMDAAIFSLLKKDYLESR